MTATVNASTSAGVIVTSDTSGALALQTAGTTALTVTSAQLVGIGTTSPAQKLHVVGTIKAANTNGNTQLTLTDTTNSRDIYFNNDNGDLKIFNYTPANTLTIDTSGNVNIKTSNAGIVFNNSSALTNSTLNDYETGTWTPTVTSVSGTLTSYTSNGTYIKIGKFVFVWFQFNITSAGSASGYAIVSSLPFSTTANNGSKALGNVREDNVTGTFYGSYVGASATQILISQFSSYSLGITWTNGFGYNGTLVYQATF